MPRSAWLLALALAALVCACRSLETRRTPQQTAQRLLLGDGGWILTNSDPGKMTFSRKSSRNPDDEGIYLETELAPDGVGLNAFVDKLLEEYSGVYQDVSRRDESGRGVRYCVINASLTASGRRLVTTVIPQVHGYLLAVYFEPASGDEPGRKDYRALINDLVDVESR